MSPVGVRLTKHEHAACEATALVIKIAQEQLVHPYRDLPAESSQYTTRGLT